VPNIVVLSGPSGSGKSTIVNKIIDCAAVQLKKVVSATTRPARTGEVNGEDYHFLTIDEFEQRRKNNKFVECEEVHRSGNWYGTLKSELEQADRDNSWALLEIDVNGALSVMAEYPQAVTIFIRTPSDEDYETRLRERGTETEDVLQRRLETVRKELKLADKYDFQVVNDDLDRAVREIADILSQKEAELHAG